jgi:hypothetical protein
MAHQKGRLHLAFEIHETELFLSLPVQGIAVEIEVFEVMNLNTSAAASAYAQRACGLVFV